MTSINTWGPSVWNLFHCMSIKLHEEQFNQSKFIAIEIIKKICYNLPCPTCREDAMKIVKNLQPEKFKTKQNLTNFVFNFHNHVNKKLKKPEFPRDELDAKYNTANIKALYSNFFIIFTMNSNVPQLMSVSFHRKETLPKIKVIMNNLLEKMD